MSRTPLVQHEVLIARVSPFSFSLFLTPGTELIYHDGWEGVFLVLTFEGWVEDYGPHNGEGGVLLVLQWPREETMARLKNRSEKEALV